MRHQRYTRPTVPPPINSVLLGPALARESGFLVDYIPDAKPPFWARWRYDSGYAPHCLVVGTSGGGKTSLLRWMILDTILSPGSKALWLADGKGADSFLMYLAQPGIADVANKDHSNPKEDAIVAMVETVYNLTHGRYVEFAKAKNKALNTGKPLEFKVPAPIIFVLDDYMDWEQGLTDTVRRQVLKWLISIGQEGREVNVHLWLATQAPYAKSVEEGLPGTLKRQLKARIGICGTMDLDSIESKMAFDDSDAGKRLERYAMRAKLFNEDRKGLGLFSIGHKEVAFKAPWIADPYHWETSAADRIQALALLPNKRLHLVEDEDTG